MKTQNFARIHFLLHEYVIYAKASTEQKKMATVIFYVDCFEYLKPHKFTVFFNSVEHDNGLVRLNPIIVSKPVIQTSTNDRHGIFWGLTDLVNFKI